MTENRPAAGLLAVLALSWGCAGAVAPPDQASDRPPVEVRTAVDQAVATTGDLITYRITVEYDPAYEVQIPEPGSEIAGFRIVDIGEEEPREEGGRRIRERYYRLRADLVGSYVLPAVEVGYRAAGGGEEAFQSVVASEIFVEVESVLPAGGEVSDIRDIKPLHEIESGWPWKWIGLGALLVALAAGGLYLRRRRRDLVELSMILPHEAAFRALDELRALDLSDPRVVRRFYFGLSETVRGYVEGRFGLNATDLTTEEILPRLGEVGELQGEPRMSLERFLEDTDRVKFAHHRPEPGEIEGAWERALSFVEATRLSEAADEDSSETEREAA